MLADIVVKVTRRDIEFFPTEEEAVAYLKGNLVKNGPEPELA